ncbi:MAG: hypothetical protein E1N59_432 [Puniceicoccaceae bacterium 5H]|nr:MAG: hypothetical protein E1N59_432 [Puniceicoccaceae bacterium 5H]
MKTTVTQLLRDFPTIRKAALAGETVIVKTREGDLRITADRQNTGLLGCMKGSFNRLPDDLDQPTTSPHEWDSTL